MFAVLLSATRRYLPIVTTVVVAYISGYALVALRSGDEAALGIALALCIACTSQTGAERAARWRWIALGVMAGLFTLEKLSLGVAIVALCAIALACAPETPPNHHQDLAIAAIGAVTIVAAAIAHSRRLAHSSGRAHSYNLPPEIVAQTSGQTVDIDPTEQTVASAYPSMRWDPLPTLQDYAAYTPALDTLDANYIMSARAPRFILRQEPSSIDGRLPIFDGPATQLAIECNHRQVAVNGNWSNEPQIVVVRRGNSDK